ncbi:RagB/SusD family nutrient uptake outer membrane protein [Mucilaginibacter terrae]|uniref:RagB/SusD domain-containing protein n=1 Tax=Mucilaginibacter terrae TaxID=1955052 RepID=A0ABU3GWB8_9SPHI|nr:RagB/SusD family nutrient uptake outer membrane protein [Mucilaginibacter terrae]MDT3404070.1 hypothetical protein [Mucilaginibacter terrae]
MKRNSYKFLYKVLLAGALMSSFSCQKLMDVKPEDQVDIANHYQTIYDANAAVIGIYGQLQGIADRYIVLNELRADLMSPTANADQYLRQLNTFSVTPDNPWADPKPFYKIILNCNDALKNFDIMLASSKLTQADYNERYADVNAMRCFLYLQLGMHWGSVPYVTDPLETVDALKDANKFPKISFNDLLDKLIASMVSRSLQDYSSTNITGSTSTSLNTTVDGYPTNLFFVNKRCLLADLYLWKGNYNAAATLYRYVSDTGYRNIAGAGDAGYWQYKANWGVFLITYNRAGDESSFLDDNTNKSGWRAIFGNPVQGTDTGSEWIWTIPFDRNFAPVNPFIDLFSNQGGRYLLTSSKLALNTWATQTQANGFVGDARAKISVRTINGQPVIAKPLYYYLNESTLIPTNVLQRQGRWLLYRGSALNLRFAEAACRDNQVKVAYALTNVGVKGVYNGVFPGTGTVPSDVTNIMQTMAPAPYDMDAREGQVPYYRSPWYRQIGTRTRANMPNLPATLFQNNDVTGMENAIVDEDAAELAFEGYRWGDLLRISLRRNDMSFLADKVYNKLVSEGNASASTARAKIMSTNGAYLPFNL